MTSRFAARLRSPFTLLAIAVAATGLAAPTAQADCITPVASVGCAEPPAEDGNDGDEAGDEGERPQRERVDEGDREEESDDRAAEDEPAPHPVDELLYRLNDERNDRGLPPLRLREDVRHIAGEHSVRMADEGRLRHNDAYFTAENRRGLGARRLGENVARGPDIETIHRVLMESDGHRANILDDGFTVVGLGAVHDGEQWWVTEDFVEPR